MLMKDTSCLLFLLFVFSIFPLEIIAKPAIITDLVVSEDFQLRLTWTAPDRGDGLACSSYIVKYSTFTDITNSSEFLGANTYYHTWITLPPGTKEIKVVNDIIEHTTYWFSIKSSSASEWSEISSTGANCAVAGPYHFVEVSSPAVLQQKPPKIENKTNKEDKIKTAYSEAVTCFNKNEYINAYDKFMTIIDTPVASAAQYAKYSNNYASRIKSKILKIVSKGKEGRDMNYAAGFLLYLDNRYDESLAEFQQFLKAEPSNTEIQKFVELLNKKIEEEKAQKINNYLVKAKAHYDETKYSEALKELEEILIISPGHLQASNLVGEIRSKIEGKKRIEEEKEKLEQETAAKEDVPVEKNESTTVINPKEGPKNKAVATIKQNKVDEEKAMEYYRIAMKKYEQGYLKKAIENLEKALNYSPNHDKTKEALQKIRQEYENQKNSPE